MKLDRWTIPSLVAASLLVVAVAVSCSKSSPYTPPGGGGGPELNSGTLAAGAGYQHTFATAGTFGYHCAIHGTAMAGSVTVVAGSNDSALVTIGPSLSYSPATVSVKPTGHVRWINSPTSSAHTVTSN